ncbi:MAG TPA: MFS transporter, partial [Kofleriaceae bacterium]|nr:MFS transporter [Kofleriaceae bacterium]
MTTRRKLLLLGSLYIAQGLPYGFFTQALPVLLRNEGMSLPLIGLAHLLMLPWALKFVWAPAIDRVQAPRFGHRRAVIVPLQLASCAVLAALALAATPGAMWPLAIAILLVNVCSATQD